MLRGRRLRVIADPPGEEAGKPQRVVAVPLPGVGVRPRTYSVPMPRAWVAAWRALLGGRAAPGGTSNTKTRAEGRA